MPIPNPVRACTVPQPSKVIISACLGFLTFVVLVGRWWIQMMNFINFASIWSSAQISSFAQFVSTGSGCGAVCAQPLAQLVMRWTLLGGLLRSLPHWARHWPIKLYPLELGYNWLYDVICLNPPNKYFCRLGFLTFWAQVINFRWFNPWVVSKTSNQVAYASLATACYNRGYCLYKYRPKFHLGVHMALEVSPPISMNPTCAWVYVRASTFFILTSNNMLMVYLWVVL